MSWSKKSKYNAEWPHPFLYLGPGAKYQKSARPKPGADRKNHIWKKNFLLPFTPFEIPCLQNFRKMTAKWRMVQDNFPKKNWMGSHDPRRDFVYSEFFYKISKKICRPPLKRPILDRGNWGHPLKEVVHHPPSRFLSFSVLFVYAFTRVISSLWAQSAVFAIYNNCRVLHLPFFISQEYCICHL